MGVTKERIPEELRSQNGSERCGMRRFEREVED